MSADLSIDLMIGETHRTVKNLDGRGVRTRPPEPLRKDFTSGLSLQVFQPANTPLLLPVTNWPAQGRMWEITEIGVFTTDGHSGVTQTTTPGGVPASTVAQQNTTGVTQNVTIIGGTITAVIVNGITVGTAAGLYVVPPTGSISITYTVAPTWVWQSSSNVTADMYAGPSAGMDSPGDLASFIGSGPVPTNILLGDKKSYAYANDRIYAWLYSPYNIPVNTSFTIAGTLHDWRIEDRSEIAI